MEAITKTECHRAKHKYCESIMSRMWDLRSRDRFCDIAFKVEEKVFRCHRHILSAGSEYFRAMLGGTFSEGSATEVTLHGVDANTFESILLFIYTGDVHINTSNVLDLIRAAGYYGLTLLEKHLIEFVGKTRQAFSSEYSLKMFTIARTAGTKSLSKFFSKFIYEDFGFFSDSPEFINFAWDSLMELANVASEAGELPLTDTFVEGILQWIRGQVDVSENERDSYVEQLLKIVRQTKSFAACIPHMLNQHVNAEQAPKKNAVAVLDERPQKLLRAFVRRKNAGQYEPEVSSIFTLHEVETGFEWAHSGELKLPCKLMKNIVIDDCLYTLIPDKLNYGGATFIRDQRAFSGAPHISMYRHQSLKRPPVLTSNFELCGMDNNIFAHNRNITSILRSSASKKSNFTVEELRRGRVLLYRRDIDEWFSIPYLADHDHSCIACDDKMVYLIGGKHSLGEVQCYDLRTSAWMNLPRTRGFYEDAACCIQDGKIWVVGGQKHPTDVEIFDPISHTWTWGLDLMRSRRKNGRLINWDSAHHGRTIISFNHGSNTHHKILFSSDRCPTRWKMIPSLYHALKDSKLGLLKSDVVEDMVVF